MEFFTKLKEEIKFRYQMWIADRRQQMNYSPYLSLPSSIDTSKNLYDIGYLEGKQVLSYLYDFFDKKIGCDSIMYLDGLEYKGDEHIDVMFVRPHTKLRMPMKKHDSVTLVGLTDSGELIKLIDPNRYKLETYIEIVDLMWEKYPNLKARDSKLDRWVIIHMDTMAQTYDFKLYNIYL